MRRAALAVALALFVPGLASAQGAQGAQPPPFDRAVRASAALELAAQQALDHAALRPSFDAAAQAERRGRKNKATGVTLMIVGGSAVVVGAIAGDTGGAVLIAGGLIAGGYGFYLYTE